ncbi:DUF2335 domain-containing protein [Agrobacterium pusense]|uniref:DUF2335 domain-containing protein n=1 Tax=Agrobacterium pusense TaxID=648995 RepID=U4Q3X6_9HYPH|nr:DUF2335 domain-containing protein [Agrobacterium pusense]CDI11956.1 protein of unknown function [Agrobacterium pusense]
MSSEENKQFDDGMKNVVDMGVKEILPLVQGAIERKTGNKVTEGELANLVPAIEEVVTEVTTMSMGYAYAGPMPHPAMMRAYVDLYPDAAKQLFQQMENEQKHRHGWENKAIDETSDERKRRDFGAYGLVVVGILAACYLGYLGATTVAGAVIAALVLGGGALVLGRQLLARHGEDGTMVHVNSDDQKPHQNTAQSSARKQRTKSAKKPGGRSR